jgi:2-polyprenyl-3-methyl-5-hydroxy-6-metoxy-1,4-benzoquinol methylase
MSKCPFCNSDSQSILVDRKDYEYNVEKKLNYWECSNLDCKLVYVSPKPTLDEIKEFYKKYSTHQNNSQNSLINPIPLFINIFRKKYYTQILSSLNLGKLKILDYGCGNANLLTNFRELGVKNLYGYDFDEKAIEFATNNGFVVMSTHNQIFQNGPYDLIFFNHVIEHFDDAEIELNNLFNYLTTEGRIYIRTPNSNSFLRKLFSESWRGWETPRHLKIYNHNNINNITGKYLVEKLWTSDIAFSGAFHESFAACFNSNGFFTKILRHLFLPVLFLYAIITNLYFKNRGDELCVILKK